LRELDEQEAKHEELTACGNGECVKFMCMKA
jgi:hypothetical protein